MDGPPNFYNPRPWDAYGYPYALNMTSMPDPKRYNGRPSDYYKKPFAQDMYHTPDMNDTQMFHTARPSGGYQFAPAINHAPIANSTHTHYTPRHSDGYQFTQGIGPTPVTNGTSTVNQPWPCENVHFLPSNHRTMLPHAPATLPSRVPVHHSDPQSMPAPQQQHVPPFKRRCRYPSPFYGAQLSTPEHQYTSASSYPSPHQPIARPQPQSPPNQQPPYPPRTTCAPPVPTTTTPQQEPHDTRGTPSPFVPPDAARQETPGYANWYPIPLLHAFNEVFGIPAMPPGHPMVQELLAAPSPLPPALKLGHELRIIALEGWWDKTEEMLKEPGLVEKYDEGRTTGRELLGEMAADVKEGGGGGSSGVKE
ncbi:MAG: hypothetical protein Q9185_004933 [Variospora sp. 1 TL-2023]